MDTNSILFYDIDFHVLSPSHAYWTPHLVSVRQWSSFSEGRCNQLTKMTLHHTYDKPRNLTLCNRTL